MSTSELPSLGYFGAGGDCYGELEHALHHGADPSERVLSDETPLHFCAETGHFEFVRLLLEAGADANARDEWGHTPLLSTAILDHDTAAAELLLRAGCDPNTPDHCGDTPLYQAIMNDCAPLVRLLLDYGADVSAPMRGGVLPAAAAQSTYVRWLLLAAGAEAPQDFPVPTLLRHPHARGGIGGVSMLTDAVDDRKLQELWGCTPLHLAALSGSEMVLHMILQLMPDVSAPDAEDRSPLYWAVHAGRREAAFLLLERGARPDGETLLRAVEQQDAPLLRRLLQVPGSTHLMGKDPTECPPCAADITPLHRAAELGAAGMLRLLLAAGADINAQDTLGQTPLLRAAKRHSMPAVLMLLEWGADPNLADEEGNTPLHLAARNADARLVRLLLEQGAAPQLANHEGRVPVQRCSTRYGAECIRLLEAAQMPPPPDEEDIDNDWYATHEEESCESLAEAAGNGDLQEVWWRLHDGEAPNARDANGRTPLHHAMVLNYVKTARCLLSHGADPHAEDNTGDTPIDRAVSHAMRCLLRRHGARLRHEPHPTPML